MYERYYSGCQGMCRRAEDSPSVSGERGEEIREEDERGGGGRNEVMLKKKDMKGGKRPDHFSAGGDTDLLLIIGSYLHLSLFLTLLSPHLNRGGVSSTS